MNTMAPDSLPVEEESSDEMNEPLNEQPTPEELRETKWEVVTKTAGLAPAQIIADRLQSEGVPARAWQEGAGQAIGLTIGLLGTGYVVVPEAYVEQAEAILSDVADYDDEEE